MTVTFLPNWLVEVGVRLLLIVFSLLGVQYVLSLLKREVRNIFRVFMVGGGVTLVLFAVALSVGHLLQQLLILTGNRAFWELIRPYSGAINLLTFMLAGAATLFCARTGSAHQGIVRERRALAEENRVLPAANRASAAKESAGTRARAEKLAAIDALTSGIAHEINNPLGIILGYTQLLLRNEPADSDRTADLKTIEKQVRHCKAIVEDLRNIARTSPPEQALCDMHALIDDAIQFVRQHAGGDAVCLRTEYDPAVGFLRLDAKKIRQVFINLLLNARQAAGGDGEIGVRTTRAADGRTVRIQVKDNGPGIPADLLARIFDPFFTTRPTGQGIGLGLAVSYGIIKNHGGDIRVASAPGKGAEFTIVLPIDWSASNGRGHHDAEPADR